MYIDETRCTNKYYLTKELKNIFLYYLNMCKMYKLMKKQLFKQFPKLPQLILIIQIAFEKLNALLCLISTTFIKSTQFTKFIIFFSKFRL